MNLSMIFPFYNEETTIRMTIDSLASQSRKADEVIFIDSGSNDNTLNIINTAKKENPELNIKVLHSGEMFPSNSINMGIKQSTNEMLMYMDCGLLIPDDWVESQIDEYEKGKADVVSGRIFTKGVDIIDQCFISHTYGYKNKCICLTGSIFHKRLLDKTGLFIENCRAGYDVDFINKVKLNGYSRVINKKVQLEYYGINYSKTIISGYKKVKLYSKSAWQAYGDKKPYLYLLGLILLIIALINLPLLIMTPIMVLYIIIRGFLVPYYKSRSIYKHINLKLLFFLPIVGACFDLARINGYIDGLLRYKQNDEKKYSRK